MRKYVVYKHTSPSGKVYIGITGEKKPEYRWGNGRGYSSNAHFHNAINKYGWDNFRHEILMSELTIDEAKNKEIELIKNYKSYKKTHGYNMDLGGCMPTPETLLKRSLTMRALWKNESVRKKWANSIKVAANTIEQKERRAAQANKQWECKERRAARADLGKAMWENKEMRNKIIHAMRHSDKYEENRLAHSEIMKEKWKDPQFKKELSLKIIEAKNKPEKKLITSRQAKERWEDKEYYFKQWGHPMAVHCIDTGEVFESAGIAADVKQLKKQGITNCCSGFRGRNTYYGMRWEWYTGPVDADELGGTE